MTLEWIDPNELKNHPVNLAIYGDTPDPELVESVKRHGVFPDHPIGYVADGEFLTIVSGHRRVQAAKVNKCKQVPCVRLKELEGDELAIRERIILSNSQRKKTPEQLAREAAELATISEERTKKTSAANLKTGTESPSWPDGQLGKRKQKTPKTRQAVAASLGVSERTAGRLVTTGKALKEAEAKGDKETAERIKEGLQESVAAGERAAKPQKNGAVAGPTFDESNIDKPYGQLLRAVDMRVKSFPTTKANYQAVRELLGRFHSALQAWRKAK